MSKKKKQTNPYGFRMERETSQVLYRQLAGKKEKRKEYTFLNMHYQLYSQQN